MHKLHNIAGSSYYLPTMQSPPDKSITQFSLTNYAHVPDELR